MTAAFFHTRIRALEKTRPFVERHRGERHVGVVKTTKSSLTNAVPASAGTAKPTLARSN